MKTYLIKLQPENTEIILPEGSNLFNELRDAGIFIHHACGGAGTCGKCKVKILKAEGINPLSAQEAEFFSAEDIKQGLRLACCVEIQGGLEIEIVGLKQSIAKANMQNYLPELTLKPAVKKVLIRIEPKYLGNTDSFMSCVEKAVSAGFHPRYLLKNLSYLQELIKNLPAKTTVTLINNQIISLEPADSAGLCYAAAVDIGTTTLELSLIDLNSGNVVDNICVLNPQLSYGIDILSRIGSCQGNPAKIKKLQGIIVTEINSLLTKMTRKINITPASIYQMAVVGNTTMLHLFLGIDPYSIGRSPYYAVFSKELYLKAADCGIDIPAEGEVYILPSISAYVGADITAGILVSQLMQHEENALFIDLGTNGEVVLSAGKDLWTTSCAAGPALEGMNISCGMPAIPGAIERVFFNDQIEFRTVGGIEAQGICGSGVIELSAELIDKGLVDRTGRFILNKKVAAPDYMTIIKGKPAVILYEHKQTQIYFSQTDFRQIQLAKGAICSAIEVLLTEAKLSLTDIKRFIIAGRFGKSIRAGNFMSLGIIPKGFTGQVDYLGNSAKSGAIMTLVNYKSRTLLDKIKKRARPIELSTYPAYEKIFTKHLLFN